MIDFAVEQLHLNDNIVALGQTHDLFKPISAVLQTGLIIHAVAVAAETNQIFITGLCHQRDMIFIIVDQGAVIVGIVPAFSQADLRTIAHGTINAVIFENLPLLWPDQINGGKTDVVDHGAQFFQ